MSRRQRPEAVLQTLKRSGPGRARSAWPDQRAPAGFLPVLIPGPGRFVNSVLAGRQALKYDWPMVFLRPSCCIETFLKKNRASVNMTDRHLYHQINHHHNKIRTTHRRDSMQSIRLFLSISPFLRGGGYCWSSCWLRKMPRRPPFRRCLRRTTMKAEGFISI